MTSLKNARIGVFDSGFGGLSVMNAITALLPYESVCYFADTARLPYGDKRPSDILEYSSECIGFLAQEGIKLLVVACHTSCVTAFDALQKRFSFPLIGIGDAGIEELSSYGHQQRLAFLGTQITVSSGVYQEKLRQKCPSAEILGLACPLFVPLIEAGNIDQPILTEQIVHSQLKPLKDTPPDAILLACTHYPLLKGAIAKEVGPHIPLIDPALRCAKQVQQTLIDAGLETSSTSPDHRFYVSGDPEKFQRLGSLFSHSPIKAISSICFSSSEIQN